MSAIENYQYFIENFEELYKKYPNKFLVLKDKEVVKTFGNFDDAADYGITKYGIGNFSVQQCVPEDKRPIYYANRVEFVGI